jgi:ABC-type protease/lipase transport system fused ATPase/permease subunit
MNCSSSSAAEILKACIASMVVWRIALAPIGQTIDSAHEQIRARKSIYNLHIRLASIVEDAEAVKVGNGAVGLFK